MEPLLVISLVLLLSFSLPLSLSLLVGEFAMKQTKDTKKGKVFYHRLLCGFSTENIVVGVKTHFSINTFEVKKIRDVLRISIT